MLHLHPLTQSSRNIFNNPGEGDLPINSRIMKIETIEIAGLAGALTALRLPFGKEVRSDMNLLHDNFRGSPLDENVFAWDKRQYIVVKDKDLTLMQNLVKRGDEHAKVVRGIMVWAKITAPVYWWCEEETYRMGHERLASESTMHIDCRGLSGSELQEAKSAIPMGKELTKVDMFSYQALRKMVAQRHNHRLPEWHQFIDWIKTLPLAEELILVGLEDRREIEEKAKRFDMIMDALENAESVNHFTELIKSMFTKEE